MDYFKKGWIYFDQLLFKITLYLLGGSVVVVGLVLVFLNYIKDYTEIILLPVFTLFWSSLLLFFLYIARLFKFLLFQSKLEAGSKINKTMLGILFSPLAVILYWFAIFFIGLASCGAN